MMIDIGKLILILLCIFSTVKGRVKVDKLVVEGVYKEPNCNVNVTCFVSTDQLHTPIIWNCYGGPAGIKDISEIPGFTVGPITNPTLFKPQQTISIKKCYSKLKLQCKVHNSSKSVKLYSENGIPVRIIVGIIFGVLSIGIAIGAFIIRKRRRTAAKARTNEVVTLNPPPESYPQQTATIYPQDAVPSYPQEPGAFYHDKAPVYPPQQITDYPPQPATGYPLQPVTGYPPHPSATGYPPQPAAIGYPPQPATTGYSPQPATGYPPQPATGYPPQPATGYPPQPAATGYSPQPTTGYPPQPTAGYAPQPPSSYPPQSATGYPQQPASSDRSLQPLLQDQPPPYSSAPQPPPPGFK